MRQQKWEQTLAQKILFILPCLALGTLLTACEPPLKHTQTRKIKGFLQNPTLCADPNLTQCTEIEGPVFYHSMKPEDILAKTASTPIYAVRADTDIEPVPICALDPNLFRRNDVIPGVTCGAWIATGSL